MEIETEEILLEKCLLLIEDKLGLGNSAGWTTQDYENLSEKIAEVTNVTLSIATLKRIWGKIRYDSKPTITTLNTLAQYLGYENWRAFRLAQTPTNGNGHHSTGVNGHDKLDEEDKKLVATKKSYFVIGTGVLVIVTAAMLLFRFYPETNNRDLSPTSYSFSSKKIVDQGIPNTVVFDYDATAAAPTDSIFIQQSWDKRLSTQVSRDQRQHTSIYYYPGFFMAKLRIGDSVVKEHPLTITTKGWLPIVAQTPVPVYFKESDIQQNGFLQLPLEKIKNANIDLQPQTPWTGYYKVGDFGNTLSHDFIFEAELKNDYSEGSAACQHTEVHLIFEGATLVIPLTIPGCVSEINFMDREGKKNDLSKFGVDFSKWVTVKTSVRDSIGTVVINDQVADEFKIRMKPLKLVGVVFRFKGTGSVKSLKISNNENEMILEEPFH